MPIEEPDLPSIPLDGEDMTIPIDDQDLLLPPPPPPPGGAVDDAGMTDEEMSPSSLPLPEPPPLPEPTEDESSS